MRSAQGGSGLGLRVTLLAALGAAAVASLAAPHGIRFCLETYAIHQLASEDDSVVREGIATLSRLQSARGAKRLFELTARHLAARQAVPFGWGAVSSLPLPEEWVLEQAQSLKVGERMLAVMVIGEKKIAAAVPILRRIASEEDEVSPRAVEALARVLPTLKLLRTETTKTGVKATFRFENVTGHKLWYYSPSFYKVFKGRVQFYSTTLGANKPSEPGESFEITEDFDWKELPGALAVSIQGDTEGNIVQDSNGDPVEYAVHAESETVEPPRSSGFGDRAGAE